MNFKSPALKSEGISFVCVVVLLFKREILLKHNKSTCLGSITFFNLKMGL